MTVSKPTDWFDDDAFWTDVYPFLFPERRFADASAATESLLRLLEPPGRSILDLCCGPGRFCIPLAEKGFAVTGVDRTAFFLDKAKARAEASGVRVEWLLQDMRTALPTDGFDAAISMFTSFGYFADKGDDLRVLENVHASLRPGGRCLIDVTGKERLAAAFQPASVELADDGAMLIQHRRIIDDWTRIENEWLVVRGETARRFPICLNIYSGQELRDLLERTGFCAVRLYGSLDGESYGLNSERLIAVAQKT